MTAWCWNRRRARALETSVVGRVSMALLCTQLVGCETSAGALVPPAAERAEPASQDEAIAEAELDRSERELKAKPWPGASPPDTAATTSSGVPYVVLQPPKGKESPRIHDVVQVRYEARTRDGTSLDGRQELRVAILELPESWRDGVLQMRQGESRRYWLTATEGLEHAREVPDGGLIMDVELVRIRRRPKPPENPGAPPANSKRTTSGLQYRILHDSGKRDDPQQRRRVEVHYAAWNPQGDLLQSTHARGRPRRLTVRGAMPGWQEAIGLLAEGSRGQFWMSAELTGIANNGKARGPLVFDIELVRVLK